MSSAKVVNHALSCHRLIHAITKVENPSTIKNSKSVFFRKGGLIALPRQQRFTSRHHSHRERNVRQVSATVFNGLPEPSINFDVEASVAEASALLALSADLDWQQYAAKLREEALGAFRKRNEREVALEQLGEDMRNWLHDSMYQSILQSSPLQSVQNIAEDELGVSIRVEELHWQAALQVNWNVVHVPITYLTDAQLPHAILRVTGWESCLLNFWSPYDVGGRGASERSGQQL